MLMERHHLITALDSTGVPYQLSKNGHWNVYPLHNFYTWTHAEQQKLEAASRFIGGLITNKVVTSYFETQLAKPGKGFRVYTGSGYDTLNEANWNELIGQIESTDSTDSLE